MTAEQFVNHPLDWYRNRLGKITGSRVGDLMVAGRKKDEVFGGGAMSYIYSLAGERSLDPAMVADDDLFGEWVDRNYKTTREMQWGIDHEAEARDRFAVRSGLKVERCGTYFDSESVLTASPDGVVMDGDRVAAVVEIKCPGHKRNMAFSSMQVEDDLKKVESLYYWQVMAEMACTGAPVCYFVDYNPSFGPVLALSVSVFHRDEKAIEAMRERVKLADAKIREIIQQREDKCYKFFNHE